MNRTYWGLIVFTASILALIVVAIIVAQPQVAIGFAGTSGTNFNGTGSNDSPALQTTGTYFWSYSAKFVCGYQPLSAISGTGEYTAQPGNYATDINIHNYNYRSIKIYKKLLVLVGTIPGVTGGPTSFVKNEPQFAQPLRIIALENFGSDFATMDDCNAIWAMAGQTGLTLVTPNLTIGYLVILSPLDLDVDVVYTAEVPGIQGDIVTRPSGISINVTRMPGKRVFVPAGTLP